MMLPCRKERSAVSGRRVLALYGVTLTCFFVVVCRLYWLAQNETYAARARAQSQVTLALPAPRGGFYDCRNRPLTGLHQTWQAVCIPGQDSYGRLYRYAGPEQQVLLYQQRNARRPFLVELEQDLSQQGVCCFPVTQRYGAAPLACHLLGYLDGEEQGVAGLEAALESVLSAPGAQDEIRCQVDARGRLLEDTLPQRHRTKGGAGVRLSISRPVQRTVEAVAGEMMSSGCVLVLDVATAKVRASVSLPAFDPNHVAASLGQPDSPLVNRALQAYAVGSVFKPVVAAAALEAGVQGLEYECPGYQMVDGQVFHCASGVAHGTVDLTAALQKSCNGYFIQLGQQLGAERVRDMAAAMGFGSAVPLAGALEADEGRLPAAVELHSSGQFANFCFGQGTLMAAPVQVAAMMNTIAAGGVYRSPCFVECAVDEVTGQELQPLAHRTARRVLSAQNAQKLTEMLAAVVEEGTGREAAPGQSTAGGKTGTAQTGQFTPSGQELKNLWFAGFWPAQEPQYTLVVLQDAQLDPPYSSAAVFARICGALALLGGEE